MLAVAIGVSIVLLPIVQRNRWLWLPSVFNTISGIITGLWLIENRSRTLFYRADQINIALNLVSSHPFTGIGWNRFYPLHSSHVLHFTPLNYGVGSGLVSLLLFVTVVAIPLAVTGRHILNIDATTAGLLGVFCVTLVEILLFKSTPSVQLFSAGVIVLSLGAVNPVMSRSEGRNY